MACAPTALPAARDVGSSPLPDAAVDAPIVSDAGNPGDTSIPPAPDAGNRQGVYVVNVVNAAAAAAVEAALTSVDEVNLPAATQAFYAQYPDEFDFLFMLPARTLSNIEAEGLHTTVNQPPIPGTGITQTINDSARYGSPSGRLKAVLSVNYNVEEWTPDGVTNVRRAEGPFLHELAHYWGVYFDDRFGFNEGWEASPLHWNWAGVYGRLGGYDPASMRCGSPSGAMPPCTPEASGLTRYEFGYFGPWRNGGVPFAMMELYLMGYADAAELPPTIPQLQGVQFVQEDVVNLKIVLDVMSIRQVSTAEIISTHGPRARNPVTNYRAAFVVVSASPAPQDVLDAVAKTAQTMANIIPDIEREFVEADSFFGATRGRATMDTLIPTGS